MGRWIGRWQGARWRGWRGWRCWAASLAGPARWEWIDPCWMQVKIQGKTKSLDASDGSAERFCDALPVSAASLPSKQCSQKQRQSQANELGSPSDQKAELHRQSQDPLPHRNGGKYTVPKVCCKVGHPPAGTRWTEPSIFAGEGHEQLIVARRTANTGKAVAEQPAAQVALKLGANEAR